MYIPLYNKSNYTLLSSLLKVEEIVTFAKEKSISQIALTDSNMYATMLFIKKCESEGIKPIIGLEIQLEDFVFVLFAKDYRGYQSLIKLSTIQSERVITLSDLRDYNKSVIAVLPFLYREKYEQLGNIYLDLFLGYANRDEENESLIITKNIVFFF